MLRRFIQRLNHIYFVMIVSFLIYMLFIIGVGQSGGRYADDCYELATGWTVTYNGQTVPGTEYSSFIQKHGKEFKEGDTIVCETVLGDYGEMQFPALMIKTRQSAVEIFVDGERIYSADMGLVEAGRFIGRRVRFVTLPQDYAGRILRTELHLSRSGYSKYGAPLFGEYRDLRWLFIDVSVPALATGLFLFLFGIVFLFISLQFSLREEKWNQAISAVLCTLMGLWILCYNDLLMLFVRDTHSTELEYLVFYLMFPLLVLFAGGLYKSRILRNAGRAGVAVCFVVLILHILGVVGLDLFAVPYQIIVMIGFTALLVYFFAKRVRKDTLEDVSIREVGMIIVVFCMLLYYIFYLLDWVFVFVSESFAMQMPCIGMLSFASMQILHYYTYVSEDFAKKQELETLSEMAFVDILTGLPNRKNAENMIEQLNNITEDYCVISIDVNGLKVVNDTKGHNAGDKLLQLTAGVLNRCFREGSFRARLSGDEFLVIMRDTTIENVEACIRLAHRMFRELDRMEPDVKHSVSIGYAFKSELPRGSARALYNIADERMYKAKREYYERLKLTQVDKVMRKEAKAI